MTVGGVVVLVLGQAWGLALAFVGFAIAAMWRPRLPWDDDDASGPGWEGAGPVGW
jgi:hypothetical protein